MSPGRVLGTARIIRTFADLLSVCPPERPRPFWLGEQGPQDAADIVCVLIGDHHLRVEDLPLCAVAVVSELAWPEATYGTTPLHRPCVEEVGPRIRAVRDGDLLVVDGDQGVVVVDPTDRVVAAFQAHALGIVPHRRLFLEFCHQPVRLPDGREIRVSASVESPPEVAAGLSAGPDGFYVVAHGPSDSLAETVRNAHGKPVAFAVHPEGCSEVGLAQAALLGDVTALLAPTGAADTLGAFRAAVEAASLALANEGLEFGYVRCGLLLREDISDPAAVLMPGVERIAAVMYRRDLAGPWLTDLLDAARSVVVPVEILLDAGYDALADQVLDLSINGVIVPPSDVQVWKEALRNSFAYA